MDSHDQWCPHQIKHVPLFSSHLRYVEGRGDVHTFLSVPISSEEAEETRREFRERLVKRARAVRRHDGEDVARPVALPAHRLRIVHK